MRRWRPWLAAIVFFAAMATWAMPEMPKPPAAPEGELGAEQYNCTLTLTADATPRGTSVTIDLEYTPGGEFVRIVAGARTVSIASRSPLGETPRGVAPGLKLGARHALTILRRGRELVLQRNGITLFRGSVPRGTGTELRVDAGAGWSVTDAVVEPVEPVAFGDNFMRSPNEPSPWTTATGVWRLQSVWEGEAATATPAATQYAQNPFAWVGQGAPALCVTGRITWDDYTMTAGVCPSFDTAVGLCVLMDEARSGLLVRWSPANDRGPAGDRLAVYELTPTGRTLLGEVRGGFVPGQWYRMEVRVSGDTLTASVDGDLRLTVPGITRHAGGVGLFTEGPRAVIFDDITVYGHKLNADLIRETDQVRISERFLRDARMGEWAAPSEWVLAPPGFWRYRAEVCGDQWMILTVTPTAARTGELTLALCGDGETLESGYRACITQGVTGQATCALYRGGEKLGEATCAPLAPGEEYQLRFRRLGERLLLEVDGDTVVEADHVAPLPTRRPALRAVGAFQTHKPTATVCTHNMLDYAFAEAPVDWTSTGTWTSTARWACSPEWSFLGGWGRGDAALWHKQRFTGDQSFEAFVAPKMEYPREREVYDKRIRDFGITICGDGRDPRSGYAGVFGASGDDGTPNARTVLMRNGKVVAVSARTAPNRDGTHQQWFDLMLRKRGETVEFWIEGVCEIVYRDPTPLEGGSPAVWTVDNGITVARARMYFATPPALRREAQVILDQPTYPEWVNVGTPLMLDFPESWSTAGKPVTLRAVARDVPAGEEARVSVAGTRVTFAPARVSVEPDRVVDGERTEHWYEIVAGDGERDSPPFALSVPCFDPARGRDDRSTLVLYRFDEGKGNVVRDRGAIGPAANLTVPTGSAEWLRGQGLRLASPTTLVSAATSKLSAVGKERQMTLEFWISPDTKYPPPNKHWAGCLLAWGDPANGVNFSVGHTRSVFLVCPGTIPAPGEKAMRVEDFGFLTSLHHCVVTWDGMTTRYYLDGVLKQTAGDPKGGGGVDWLVGGWRTSAPLMLGGVGDGQCPYLGTYYLVAVHGRCLSDADVQRHFAAGPSAK